VNATQISTEDDMTTRPVFRDEWHQIRKLSPVAWAIMKRLRSSTTRSMYSDYLVPTWTNKQVKNGADRLIKRELVNVDLAPMNRRKGIWYIELREGV
jgi:hypothetical protein